MLIGWNVKYFSNSSSQAFSHHTLANLCDQLWQKLQSCRQLLSLILDNYPVGPGAFPDFVFEIATATIFIEIYETEPWTGDYLFSVLWSHENSTLSKLPRVRGCYLWGEYRFTVSILCEHYLHQVSIACGVGHLLLVYDERFCELYNSHQQYERRQHKLS